MSVKNFFKIDDNIIKLFISKYSNNKLGQAYIFLGNENNVKNNTLKEIFKIINCLNNKELSSYCGVCSNCVKIIKDFHPDYIEIPLLPNKQQLVKIQFTSDSSTPNPDKVVSLNDKLKYTNYEAEYRFVVIHATDTMESSCANSFLKGLEEPPANTVFFLLTKNINNLLPTIISRCNVILLSPIDNKEIIDFLKQDSKLDEKEIIAVLNTVCNNIEEAEFLLENQRYLEFRKETIKTVIMFLRTKDYSKVIPYIKDYYDKYYKKDSEHIFKKCIYGIMNTFYRDVLIWKLCKMKEKIINQDFLEDIVKVSTQIEVNNLLIFSFKLYNALQNIKFNINPKVVLDNLFIEKEEALLC